MANTAAPFAQHPIIASEPVSDEERYLFDVQGFLAVPGILDEHELNELNALLDVHVQEQVDPEATMHRFMEPSLLHWGQPVVDLIDHPRIRPYLREFMAGSIRLDHDYADVIRSGRNSFSATMHGGNTPYDEICSYHFRDGRIRSGLLAVALNLHDVPPGQGGFACIPGSHKSNLPLPPGWISLESPAGCVRSVPGKAGSMVIFTEALTHGTLPWLGVHERRTFFLKYSPAGVSWHASVYQEQSFGNLTEGQRMLLEGPNARYGGRRAGVR